MTKTEQRVALSERTITGWEAMGKPGGPVEDNLRMIGEELAALRRMSDDHPELAKRIAALCERYGRMHLKLKLSAH